MHRERLPLHALPAWMKFHDAFFAHVEIQDMQEKGHGLAATDTTAAIGLSSLVTVPRDLVLNTEAVEEYAKEDSNFRTLLDACGRKVSQELPSSLGQ